MRTPELMGDYGFVFDALCTMRKKLKELYIMFIQKFN